jgi:sugar O-acyltransferase (sialic acid O-acetyltransferase NeuD family)
MWFHSINLKEDVMDRKKSIIFGTGSFAEMVHFYLSRESEYKVVVFSATEDRIERESLFGLPVVAFEGIEREYPPSECEMFIAIGYTNLNKTRADFFKKAKEKGYKLLTYISPKATHYPENLKIGENCFIFEDNTVQPYVEIGDDVIIWSGNHIGHHSKIGNHIFIASHVVISGHSCIKDYTFIGVNATLRDGITVEKENIIGAGALIMRNTKEREVYGAQRTEAIPKDSSQIKL